jgi:hypothetical protein
MIVRGAGFGLSLGALGPVGVTSLLHGFITSHRITPTLSYGLLTIVNSEPLTRAQPIYRVASFPHFFQQGKYSELKYTRKFPAPTPSNIVVAPFAYYASTVESQLLAGYQIRKRSFHQILNKTLGDQLLIVPLENDPYGICISPTCI